MTHLTLEVNVRIGVSRSVFAWCDWEIMVSSKSRLCSIDQSLFQVRVRVFLAHRHANIESF